MAFSGHETFHIREGWLHKGLRLLHESPRMFDDEFAHDELGVGRNMAKSIRHWLIATGLAGHVARESADGGTTLFLTDLGRLVYRQDPHFTSLGTWWVAHINLIQPTSIASTWTWFFNRYAQARFERATAFESLKRYLELNNQRLPSMNTLGRDLDCMLRTYARVVPMEDEDPEEAMDCPMIDLGLLRHFKNSGYYQLNLEFKDIPPEIFGYSLALTFAKAATGAGAWDISLLEATQIAGGPGRAFAMQGEAFFNALQAIEAKAKGDIQIAGLAGQRLIRARRKTPLQWLTDYYRHIDAKDTHAA